jgi:hypothetical protein
MVPELLNRKLEKMMLCFSVRSTELSITYAENGKCVPNELAVFVQ